MMTKRWMMMLTVLPLLFTLGHQRKTLAGYSDVTLYNKMMPSKNHPLGQRHPDAPKEIEQFAFMVGKFDCQKHHFQKDGNWRNVADMPWSKFIKGSDDALSGVEFNGPEEFSKWDASWFMNGWGIMDQNYSEKNIGVSIRTFDVKKKQWNVAFYSPGFQGNWHGGLRDGNMVLDRKEMDKRRRFIKRLTFFDISSSGFKWTSEQVLEEGGVESWGYIECVRQD